MLRGERGGGVLLQLSIRLFLVNREKAGGSIRFPYTYVTEPRATLIVETYESFRLWTLRINFGTRQYSRVQTAGVSLNRIRSFKPQLQLCEIMKARV